MESPIDIAAVRSELQLSQAAFAERLQVDQSTVSLWETGKTKPGGPARQMIRQMLEQHRGRSDRDTTARMEATP
jgi:DNA-binding transcriptional regulator YiaG